MSELVASTKTQIKRIVPYAKDISIKIERDHDLYRSKIHVQIPGTILHAEKKAQTVWEAMELSYHAILKQIDKMKAKKQRKRVPRIWKWQMPIMPPP
jgi:ribosome-associated translation inhibitor RaiA